MGNGLLKISMKTKSSNSRIMKQTFIVLVHCIFPIYILPACFRSEPFKLLKLYGQKVVWKIRKDNNSIIMKLRAMTFFALHF